MITIKDLLGTYWAQITYLITGIGVLIFYWIKRIYDFKTKKNEIRYSLYYQRKIESFDQFCQLYNEIVIHLFDIITCYSNKEIAFKKLDEKVLLMMKSFAQLRFFSNSTEFERSTDVIQSFKKIYELLKDDLRNYSMTKQKEIELTELIEENRVDFKGLIEMYQSDFDVR